VATSNDEAIEGDEGREQFSALVDAWRTALDAWRADKGGPLDKDNHTVGELIEGCNVERYQNTVAPLRDAFLAIAANKKGERGSISSAWLGRWLTSRKGRRVNGWWIECIVDKVGSHYRLRKAQDAADP